MTALFFKAVSVKRGVWDSQGHFKSPSKNTAYGTTSVAPKPQSSEVSGGFLGACFKSRLKI